MKITESVTSTFWKGEQRIRASVQDGDTLYKVSLYVKGSQVRDYSCSCVNGNSCRGMCAHAKLVWEQWKKEQEQHSGRSSTQFFPGPHDDPGVYQPGSGKDH